MGDQVGLGIDEIIGDKREDILRLAAQYKAYNVRVFGSVARGEARPDIDVDIIVDFRNDARLWDMVDLWQALTQLLGREVNLVEEASLKGRILSSVRRDAVQL